MKKIVFIACALTCTVSLNAGHSKELKLMSPEGVLGKRRFLPPYFVGLQQIN